MYQFYKMQKPCPLCGGRMASVRDYDVYVCENEHIISGPMMEVLEERNERELREIADGGG